MVLDVVSESCSGMWMALGPLMLFHWLRKTQALMFYPCRRPNLSQLTLPQLFLGILQLGVTNPQAGAGGVTS
jgi:hypothetical protein